MMENKFGEIWVRFYQQIIPWNNQCSIHEHIYISYDGELVLINFIDEFGNLTTKNNINYKVRHDYIKVLSK